MLHFIPVEQGLRRIIGIYLSFYCPLHFIPVEQGLRLIVTLFPMMQHEGYILFQ